MCLTGGHHIEENAISDKHGGQHAAVTVHVHLLFNRMKFDTHF